MMGVNPIVGFNLRFMKQIIFLFSTLAIFNCCSSTEEKENDLIIENYWYPVLPEKNYYDTIFNIEKSKFLIRLESYSLNSEVQEVVFRKGEKRIHHFYDYGVDIKLFKNDSMILSKSFRKEDFKLLAIKELIDKGTLDCNFIKMENNEFVFKFEISRFLNSCRTVHVKYIYDTKGNERIEEYSEEYYRDLKGN